MTASSGPQAVSNGRAVDRYDQGYCQKYVRDPCWKVPSLYGSAIDAWNGSAQKHPGDRNPPEGAPCYYRGGSYGHAVISVGGGRIRSTDCTSATYVNDTDLGWPERAWGGYAYLGWTGDLNGVDLPLGGSQPQPQPPQEDEMPEYVNVIANDQGVQTGDWRPVTWEGVSADTAGDIASEGNPGLNLSGRMYVATLYLVVGLNKAAEEGATIRTRHIEGEVDSAGNWDITETGYAAEHQVTSGDTYLVDTRAGKCGKDRRLRWQVNVPVNGTIVQARCELVCW